MNLRIVSDSCVVCACENTKTYSRREQASRVERDREREGKGKKTKKHFLCPFVIINLKKEGRSKEQEEEERSRKGPPKEGKE